MANTPKTAQANQCAADPKIQFEGEPLYIHYTNRYNRLLPGDMDFVDLSHTIDPENFRYQTLTGMIEGIKRIISDADCDLIPAKVGMIVDEYRNKVPKTDSPTSSNSTAVDTEEKNCMICKMKDIHHGQTKILGKFYYRL